MKKILSILIILCLLNGCGYWNQEDCLMGSQPEIKSENYNIYWSIYPKATRHDFFALLTINTAKSPYQLQIIIENHKNKIKNAVLENCCLTLRNAEQTEDIETYNIDSAKLRELGDSTVLSLTSDPLNIPFINDADLELSGNLILPELDEKINLKSNFTFYRKKGIGFADYILD